MTGLERTVRSMSKAERRSYLRERGWRRLGPAHGAECWVRFDPDDDDDPAADRTFYTLAAAIRRALGDDLENT